MAIIKCKMCGGDMELTADKTFGTCEYCGSTMTLPKIDDDQRAAAFNRGNHFRRSGEFDKALAVYERIVAEDDTDAEAHWCCALCRFGIEYVEDPTTYEWLPTCHRASFDSFMEDVDYLAALEHSDGLAKRQYQRDAAKIAEVQRGILATSQNEEPFDVFICYKESDPNGDRTVDSTLAQDIYYQLTEAGYRVFFSRITLEDKVGTEYEPYIFAALNSAKIMVALGTKAEYFNAVWVKNEWSRFLAMMRKDRTKLLLPCYRDMDPYELPEQLSVLQSYDMSKIGFVQDLLRGIKKVLDVDKKPEVVREVISSTAQPVEPLLKRGHIFLEDGDWAKADEYFDKVLDIDPENGNAYAGKLCAACNYRKLSDMAQDNTRWGQGGFIGDTSPVLQNIRRAAVDNKILAIKLLREAAGLSLEEAKRAVESLRPGMNDQEARRCLRLPTTIGVTSATKGHYEKALRYGSSELKAELNGYLEAAKQKQAEEDKQKAYVHACEKMNSAKTEQAYREAAKQFEAIGDYKQAIEKRKACLANAEDCARRDREKAEQEKADQYRKLCHNQESWTSEQKLYELAADFRKMGDYKDCAQRAAACHKQAEELRLSREAAEKLDAEIRAAYAQEYQEMDELKPLQKKKAQLIEQKNTLEKKLSKKAGIIIFSVFFIIGLVEAVIGIGGGSSDLALLGGLCTIIFGIARFIIAADRRKAKKALKQAKADIADCAKKLNNINSLITLDEFSRIYKLRQTAEGKAQLEAEEKAKAEAEAKEKMLAARAKAKKKKRNIILSAIVLLVVAVLCVVFIVIPSNKFNTATGLVEQGDYASAKEIFTKLNDFNNSDVMVAYCEAKLLEADKKFDEAIAALDMADGFQKISDPVKDEVYSMAEKALEIRAYENGASLFSKLGDYSDSAEMYVKANELIQCKADYDFAMEMFNNREYLRAANAFRALEDFENSDEMAITAQYKKLVALAELYVQFQLIDTRFDLEYGENCFHMPSKQQYEEIESEFETAYFKLLEEDYEVDYSIYNINLLADYIKNEMDALGETAYVNELREKLFLQAEESTEPLRKALYYKLSGHVEEALVYEYEYAKANYNTSDAATYAFLRDLKSAEYQDAATLYSSLYKVSVDIFFNLDKDDTSTRLSWIPQDADSPVAHYVVKGGYEGGKKVRVLVEKQQAPGGVPKQDFVKGREQEITVIPGANNTTSLGSPSGCYYRVTVFDAENDAQLATATVYKY